MKIAYSSLLSIVVFSFSCFANQDYEDDNYSKIVQSFENRKKIEISNELSKSVVNEDKIKCLENSRTDLEIRRCKERFD